MICQPGPGFVATPTSWIGSAVQLPNPDLASAGVLPQDVVVSDAEEIASALNLPYRRGVADDPGTNDRGSIHVPDSSLASAVLKQQVGIAIAVEVARSPDVTPGGAGGAGINSGK